MTALTELLTSTELLIVFGIASGVLSTFAYIPYILDTIARRTEPQRASWLIWSVLGSIAFVSQVFEGATSSLWFAGVQVTGTVIVFVLSIRAGKGRFLSKSDYMILAAAAAGLVLWYLTENAAYALAITISISLLGGLATAIKAYHKPESETLITWVVSFIASACAIFSVGAVDFTLLAYPLYLFTLYLAFIVAIVMGRARAKPVDQTAKVSVKPRFFRQLTSGLRSTADAVIVGAAFVFVFNWLDAIDYSNHASANTSPARGRLTSDTNAQLTYGPFDEVSARELRDLSVLPVPMSDSESIDTTAMALSSSTSRPGSTSIVNVKPLNSGGLPKIQIANTQPDTSTIIVVAVGWNNATGLVHKPLILHDADPVAIDAKAQVRSWRSMDNHVRKIGIDAGTATPQGAGSQAAANPARSDSSLNNAVEVELPAKHSPSIANVIPETIATFAPLASDSVRSYLLLDEDDPFSQLIVTSETSLLAEDGASDNSQIQLKRGARVKALATSGEWFKVHVDDGPKGYIHHSFVRIEALSSHLSN